MLRLRYIAVFITITLVTIVITIPGALNEFNDSLFNQIYYTFMMIGAVVFYAAFVYKMRQLRKNNREH